MSTLIVGCGALGRRVGRLLAGRGEPAFGIVRSSARGEDLAALGIVPVIADVLDADSLTRLPAVDRVLYCVGFDRAAGVSMRTVYVEGLRNVLDQLAGRVGRWVYASSTSVHGQEDGGWIDEDSPADPRHEAGRVCLDAENLVRERGGDVVILRFAGLYGPGRIVRKAMVERGEVLVGDPSKYLNLIHLDDAAGASVAAFDRGEGGRTYLACDDRPVERREYYDLVARCLGAPSPRFVLPAPEGVEVRREETNKRVSNRRLRSELGVQLAYPDITTGVPAALLAERSQSGVRQGQTQGPAT